MACPPRDGAAGVPRALRGIIATPLHQRVKHATERLHPRPSRQAIPATSPPGKAGGRRLRPQRQADPTGAGPARVSEGLREVGADPPGRPHPARGNRVRAPRIRPQRTQGRDRARRPRRACRQDRAQAGAQGRRRGPRRRGRGSCRGRGRCRGRSARSRRSCREEGSREEGMTPPPLAVVPGVSDTNLEYVGIALIVFLVFVVGSRVVSTTVVAALRRRNVRADMVQVGGRVVTFFLVGLGLSFAIGFAFQSQNLTLAGILLATIVASFGVQDLLKDYVSGYYILLERHIRVGDR